MRGRGFVPLVAPELVACGEVWTHISVCMLIVAVASFWGGGDATALLKLSCANHAGHTQLGSGRAGRPPRRDQGGRHALQQGGCGAVLSLRCVCLNVVSRRLNRNPRRRMTTSTNGNSRNCERKSARPSRRHARFVASQARCCAQDAKPSTIAHASVKRTTGASIATCVNSLKSKMVLYNLLTPNTSIGTILSSYVCPHRRRK